MSSNKSIAVWCVPRAGQTGIEIDVHFNYWRIAEPQRRSLLRRAIASAANTDFAEVGVMVEDVRLVDRLNLFIPAPIKSESIQDCAPCFENQDVLQGIFNERLSADPVLAAGGPLFCAESAARFSAACIASR